VALAYSEAAELIDSVRRKADGIIEPSERPVEVGLIAESVAKFISQVGAATA
jgi:hypothetical protein